MKHLRNLIALAAVSTIVAVFTGCGDDDDDDDDNGGNQQAGPAFAPASNAAFQNNTYTIDFGNGQNAQLTFPTAGTYSLTSGGVAETGVITGLTRNGENYIATLTPTDNNGRVRAGEMRVAFTQKTANSFAGQFTIQEQGGARTYPFNATVNQPGNTNGGNPGNTDSGNPGNTNGGNPGNTNGGIPGNTDSGTTGTQPPTSLAGKVLQLNYTSVAGGEKFTFTSDTAAIYEDGPDTFTYQWDVTGTRIIGDRRKADSSVFAHYDIDLTFNANSGTNGTATVIYQEPGGPASPPDQANFTLTP